MKDIDKKNESFGDEWERFAPPLRHHKEAEKILTKYLPISPSEALLAGPIGFRIDCGSGCGARLRPIEQHLSRKQFGRMKELAGLLNVRFPDNSRHWCAVDSQA